MSFSSQSSLNSSPSRTYTAKASTADAASFMMPQPSKVQSHWSIHIEKTLDNFQIKHQEKVMGATDLLNKVVNEPVQSLIIVNAIQRLRIVYLFREQIQAILQWQYTHFSSLNHGEDDICVIALRFRLLRQEDAFQRFKDKNGGFHTYNKGSIKGLMELHEASQMSIEGEDILDEAEYFSSKSLNELLTRDLDHEQVRMIESTLRYPYHKSFVRLLAPQNFANDMHGMYSWIHDLLEVAKVERKLVGSLHQMETHQINRYSGLVTHGKQTCRHIITLLPKKPKPESDLIDIIFAVI